MSKITKKGTPVLVTTQFRGVFFGYMDGEPHPEKLLLTQARVCIYWRGIKGFGDLAASGPGKACRIGPAVSRITLYGITSVTECTPEAVEAWEAAPWA